MLYNYKYTLKCTLIMYFDKLKEGGEGKAGETKQRKGI